MTGSKFLLVVSVISTVFLAACSGPGTYPVSGIQASSTDPVMDMDIPGFDMGVEAR
ncbi:hypothetical protein [Ruegeria arenilitoris]|uniref:hypothetical protein n=1 Tax=Ruegeria arenilitoris TaxID=1173585 RepID=UPI00147AD754|nr:hypothetical protein [Ruegeria arenilitoris]